LTNALILEHIENMSSFVKAAEKQENDIAFGVKGGNYMATSVRSQIKSVIKGWINGQEKDTALHEALNALEDETGATSYIRSVCDDIRYATRFECVDERERYLEVIQDRIKVLLDGI